MSKQNLTLIVIALIVLLSILFLSVLVMQRKKTNPSPSNQPTNINLPSPTTVEVRITTPPTLTPTPILPTSTGVFEEQLPKEQQDLSTQKQALKTKLPINNNNFALVFDYGEDKFIVSLKEPKETNKKVFEDWLKANYPAIPIDRFLIK
ncbi:hypothetical protein COS31_03405 [Candidatus Roizmanbacteria bacterium CG02_land_8_20_14_3_00_36_15]|uniref:Uncharacterized protein n=2 Tax=Candidatus Roizmaniibacteriota TaxID=1752723 RepID=A0A2M8KLF2_9BACT|nr:MAG: hypothetical protein COS51_03390 [Candidatus Roizmanbacteria bacterium CG03_land_8_20_14_0_80_36_21]PIV37724.1 MAG: hypothetical protein COS31_03405 [Candidatus Roizmanbacteria bacterium CG02_land_8_20_14_3_00_36_15]PIY70615.1 MAG: hypothetical protein COY89_00205 [Candidatus Roizmanbacteria bacterium CG_4_10_14_0_8_um_filter_36_36]PJA53554.1 MAG: hypothetical protein CO166_01620 [Candidatus Roizmanbacteria bacterium CG_4_9_14_3_um_filter_36_11]PJC81832.1 MAG: hypothetical protein CO007